MFEIPQPLSRLATIGIEFSWRGYYPRAWVLTRANAVGLVRLASRLRQQFLGVVAGFGVHICGQHTRLLLCARHGERLDVSLVAVFADAHMILAQGGDLRCMGNTNDLGVLGEITQMRPTVSAMVLPTPTSASSRTKQGSAGCCGDDLNG